MRPRRSIAVVTTLLLASVGGRVAAQPGGTDCGFGGPTPGWQAVRFNLAEGSTFLTLELGGARVTRPVNDDQNWHLAQGVFVVNAATLALEAYRIDSQGMAPRRAVVRTADGPALHQPVVAPDLPYEHHASKLRGGLPPGEYLVIAFGSDGGSTLQNEWWSAGVQVSGTHACAKVGIGETFDVDHTDFTGGTQAYVPGAGYAEEIAHSFESDRSLVVGLIEAQSQARAASDISLDYRTPSASGSLSQAMIPFVSGAGEYSFEGRFRGAYPVILVAGVGLDLS